MPVIIRGNFMGGGKIKDATATPSDVASGKVFYNNDGRQVGMGTILKKVYITPNSNAEIQKELFEKATRITLIKQEHKELIINESLKASNIYCQFFQKLTINGEVIGLNLDGTDYFITIPSDLNIFVDTVGDGSGFPGVYYGLAFKRNSNGISVYTGNRFNGKNIAIFYK